MSDTKKNDYFPPETEIGEVFEVSEGFSINPDVLEYVAQHLGTPPNDVDGTYSADVMFMAEKFSLMTDEDAISICNKNIAYHEHDPNFSDETKDLIRDLLDDNTSGSDDSKEDKEAVSLDPNQRSMLLRYWATIFHWWSPYPEVRAVTDPFDTDEGCVLTWRVWVLGTIWVGVAAFVNQFFDPRYPTITLSPSVCQLLLYPSGLVLQYCLPDWGFSVRGHRFSLNPGKWSQKEQLLATVMVNCANGTPYVAENIFIQYMPMYYNQKWAGSFGYGFLLMLVTQFMGFGLAGVLRRLAVYPVMSLWPTILPTLAVNKALLAPSRRESINGWTITRYKFFFLIFFMAFLYFWIPSYLWTATSVWNWMTWIAPNNADLAIVTGQVNGMGYNPISTFDWSTIKGLGFSPILLPLYTTVNQYIGMFISGLFILAVFYTNNNYSRWLPINDNNLYDNTGQMYNVSKILTNYLFDEKKYQEYSPPYYTAANLVLYGAYFASYPMAFVYTGLCFWRTMGVALKDTFLAMRHIHRSNYEGLEDPFSRIQKKHKEVPDWWFYAILVIMFGLSVALVEHWPTQTPVWVIVFCLGLCVAFLLPFTIFYSLSGVLLTLNVLGELVIGYALPGSFQALSTTKALVVQIADQAMNYTTDQKTTHYAHLPPRSIFAIQLWATLVNGLVCLGVMQFQFSVKDICTKHNAMKFSCPNENTLFSASIIWGIIGPKRIFDHEYPVLKWMFLLGAGVGFLFWAIQFGIPEFLRYKYPEKSRVITKYQRILTQAHPLIIVNGFLNWAPFNLSFMTSTLYVAIGFNWFIKRRFLAWWRKYAYVFSAAMDTGVALSAIVIFFAVQYNDYALSWWGNNVSNAGVDGSTIPTPPLPDVGYFGPGPGTYP